MITPRPAATRKLLPFVSALLTLSLTPSLFAASAYPLRPEDPKAVYLTPADFPVKADGTTDDSAALQQAINHLSDTTRFGILYIPEGKYCIAKTVYIWQGIRLVGYGEHRPTFILAPNTPGFQTGTGHYMFQFADNKPNANNPNAPIIDASEFTFYSAMSNIDFDLKDGNPAAVAIRFHVAQHSILSHMDFHVGTARAALEDIGNQAYDLHISGGQYGIITKRTAPVWQFLLMDSSFDNQSVAAINTQEAGFTLIRDSFAHMPIAIETPAGQVEQLYARDLTMEDIRTAVIAPGDSQNLRSETTLENIACTDVPHFYQGEQSLSAPAKYYVQDHFSLGLDIADDGRERGITLRHKEHPLTQPAPAVPSDIPALPPMAQWVNVHTLNVKGDGATDDTAALQAAIDSHQALFLPLGTYRVSAPIMLKPDTVLIGMNPGSTTIALATGSPAFAGEGDPIGVLNAPRGGKNIVSALAVTPGGNNPRAAGVLWLAGPTSLLDDVSFPGGGGGGGGPRRGGRGAPPAGAPPATAPRAGARADASATFLTAAPPAAPGGRRGAAPPGVTPGRGGAPGNNQNAPDIVVKDNGGGIFRGNWPHATGSSAGLHVENTSTPSKVYQLSNEHHLRVEIQFHNVQNWDLYDVQTEEENPAGADAISMEIQDCQHMLFANTYMYRVSRNVLPKTNAIMTRNSDEITFDNVKVFSQTRIAFDNPVFDETSSITVRPHFFTHFTLNKNAKAPAPLPIPALFATGAKLEKFATGFSNATSLTSDPAGNIYFTDAAMHNIYRYSPADKKADVIAQVPGNPMVMSFVAPNSLLIITYEKTVYSLDVNPKTAGEKPQPKLVAETPDPLPDTTLLLPTGLHNELVVMNDMMQHHGYIYRQGSNTAIVSAVENERRGYFYAPDSTTAVMAGGTWRPNLQASQLTPFKPGDTHLLTSEDDAKTYLATLQPDGKFTTKLFTQRGGNAAIADSAGNVYLAGSQLFIFDKSGAPIATLETPEYPTSVLLAGRDHKTLYLTARSSLYAIPLK